MGGIHRIVLGKYKDAAEGAALTRVATRSTQSNDGKDLKLIEEALVARVRRHLGNKCAKVFLAYLHGRSWRKTGIPKRTFYYALKKVKDFFGAHEYWVKLMSAKKKRCHRLH